MNKQQQKQLEKFTRAVVKYVEAFDGGDDIKQLMETPDSKMILMRSYHEWSEKDTKPGWSRQKMMDYGAKCAAHCITMSRMPMQQ